MINPWHRFTLLPLPRRLRWITGGALCVAWVAATLLLFSAGMLSPTQASGLSAMLAVLCLLAWLALRRWERLALAPLAELASDVRRLAAAHDPVPLHVPDVPDDVATVRADVNRVVDRLRAASRHEDEYLGRMEDLVQQRTQALHATIAALEAASRAKSRFVASLSHQVRTPMNGVLGMAQLLSATRLDATQRNYLDLMQRSANGLLGLMDELIDYSRLETSTLELASRPLALRELLDEVAATVYSSTVERSLMFECHLPPDLPQRVQGDAMRLRQVCLNLLHNAIKFTRVGQVTLSAQRAPEGIVIEVADTGPGIPADMQPHIFMPFVQSGETQARRDNGLGLGLSTVDTLVRAMKGRIDVKSEANRGATFRVHLLLPVLADDEATSSGKPGRPLRVGVVSDTPGSQQSLRDRLGFLGHACVAALTWRELSFTPETLANAEPDLVLYDEPMTGWPAGDAAKLAHPRPAWTVVPIHRRAPLPEQSGPLRLARPLSDAALQRALSTADEAARPAPAAADTSPAGRGLVLLVEDNAINQVVARSFLEHLGFDVNVSGDAGSALTSLRERDYSLILMDCQMPGMDGFEITRRIRAGEVGARAQRTPIVALTAHASPADRQRCLDAGMNDYVAKPIEVKALASTLDRWLTPARA